MSVQQRGEPPWGPAVATGIGSLPSDDVDEACRVVLGELPDLPHLPELPARGPGADVTGRAATLLAGLHVDLQPAGWRLVDRAGLDEGRAATLLRRDLDALEVAAYGYRGALKVQVAGPLTLAATLELPRGGRAVADHGARRDLTAALAEGVAEHIGDVRRRVPGARVVLQLDEPALPAVLAGEVPTASGFGRHRAVPVAEAEDALRSVLEPAAGGGVVHCCAAAVPVGLIAAAGARALSFDLGRVRNADVDEYAEAVDAGLDLWPGVVTSTEPAGAAPSDADLARRVLALWQRLGVDDAAAAARTVITPACGLAAASPGWARQAYGLARRTAAAVGAGG